MNSAVDSIRTELDAATVDAEAASKAHQVTALAILEGNAEAVDLKKAHSALIAANQRVADLRAAITAAEARKAQEREEAVKVAQRAAQADFDGRIHAVIEAAKKWDAQVDVLADVTRDYDLAVRRATQSGFGTPTAHNQRFAQAQHTLVAMLAYRLYAYVGQRERPLGMSDDTAYLTRFLAPLEPQQ